MNALSVGTPASMTPGISAQRVRLVGRDHEAQADVDRRIGGRGRLPFPQPHGERPGRRLRRARPRVVERQERRGAAERRRHRVLEEPVRLRVGRDARVGVDVDDPGEHEEPAGIDDLACRRRRPGQVRLDRRDPAALDRDVGNPRAGRRDDRAAANHEVRHGQCSVISISWAPSQRHRRPTSRSRSSQPSSGRTVAKWFAASWPTFDDVAHDPYGKKISHSLIPPG